jgi:P4 family phage/plasmid primase-like protien
MNPATTKWSDEERAALIKDLGLAQTENGKCDCLPGLEDHTEEGELDENGRIIKRKSKPLKEDPKVAQRRAVELKAYGRAMLADLYDLLGDAVLLPIDKGSKRPLFAGWQKTTFDASRAKESQAELAERVADGGNIGVLLGEASDRLVAIDLDTDEDAREFFALNPWLNKTLLSRGARGCQFWIRLTDFAEHARSGDWKHTDKHDDNGEPLTFAEWRSNGRQSVVFGKHPSGNNYERPWPNKPSEVLYADIKWPDNVYFCPDGATKKIKQPKETARPATAENNDAITTSDADFRKWASKFTGDLRTLDVRKLVTGSGIAITTEDGEKLTFRCPREHAHTNRNGDRDCALYFPGVGDRTYPSGGCFHKSCGLHDVRALLDYFEEQDNGCTDRNCAKTFGDDTKQSWPEVEGESATRLHERIGQVRCVSDDWYVERSGIWLPTDRDFYRPIALDVLPDDWRTQARSVEVLKRLEGEQQVTRDQFCGASKFDKDGAVLVAVANGTLRISPDKSELLSTDPAHGFTAALPVAWDDDALMPLFCQVLKTALPDPSDRELLLDVLSTALLPDCRHEAALVLQGEAGTGKSTVIAPVTEIFGSACASLSMADLCHPSGYKLAMLHNKLINLATELNTLEMDDSGLFKQLVSGERFTARPIYGKPFEMRSTATLVFLANSLPRFKHGTDAEVRRLRFVKFSRRVEQPDLTLKDRVALEAPGVFAELVRRAQELLGGRPLSEPGEFGRETARRFSVSNDPVGQFVARCCKLGSDLECEKAHVYDAFIQFRDQYGISDKFDESAFFRTLYDRFHSIKSRYRRFDVGRRYVLTGIDLTSDED